jgi:hypothetical protein
MADEGRWRPMSRDQLAELLRGQRLEDRRGRVWTVTGPPYQRDGLAHVVIRSGDLVRQVPERWADDYHLLDDAGTR